MPARKNKDVVSYGDFDLRQPLVDLTQKYSKRYYCINMGSIALSDTTVLLMRTVLI